MLLRGPLLAASLMSLNAMASVENTDSLYSAFTEFQCVDSRGQQTARFYFDLERMVAHVDASLPGQPKFRELSCEYGRDTGDLRCYAYKAPVGHGFTYTTSGEFQSYTSFCGFAGCKTTYSEKSSCFQVGKGMTLQ